MMAEISEEFLLPKLETRPILPDKHALVKLGFKDMV